MIFQILSLFFVLVSYILIVVSLLHARRKRDEAFNSCMRITNEDQLIPMKGRLVVVPWYIASRYWSFKWSIYAKMTITLSKYAFLSTILALICCITRALQLLKLI